MKTTHLIALTATIVACTAATASARPVLDPPSSQSSKPSAAAIQLQDLRSPDQRFPSAPARTQDIRNPFRPSPLTVDPKPVQASVVTAVEVPGDGFQWVTAGIGAAGGIAILAILAGMAMAVAHRRQGPRVTA